MQTIICPLFWRAFEGKREDFQASGLLNFIFTPKEEGLGEALLNSLCYFPSDLRNFPSKKKRFQASVGTP